MNPPAAPLEESAAPAGAVAPGPRPGGRALALVFVLYFAGAQLGIVFTVMPEGLAVFWPPNAVLLAALLRFGPAHFPAIALLGLAGEIAADWPVFTLFEALAFGLINLAEASLAYVLLSRWRFDARFPAVGDLWKFVLAGPVLAAAAAGLMGGAVYAALRDTDTTYLEFARIWWFGDALGLLIVTPLLLAFGPFRVAAGAPRARLAAADALVGLAAAAALALLFLAQDGRLQGLRVAPVILLPFVLYASARFPGRWSTVTVAAAAAMLVALLHGERNPFGPLPPRDTVMAAQELLLVMGLMGLGLSALLEQLRLRRTEIESRVTERTAELSRANERLAELSVNDTLTGLRNRRGLYEAAERELARAARSGEPLALLMLDLDRFKAVNDRHGHLVGDEVLRRTAVVLRRLTRPSDTCARYGGEELVVLAPKSDLENARALAERIRLALPKEGIPCAHGLVHVTVSIGVTTVAAGETSLAEPLKRADAAMYRAKQNGRDRVECLPPPQAATSTPGGGGSR